MAHRSRLGAVIIDCQTEDLTDATAFWSGVLGEPARIDVDGKYALFEKKPNQPKVLLQAVDHDPRVHLDLETNNTEAERARLEKIGAREVGRAKGWIIMEAPTGHRFCLISPQADDFPGDAARWED